MDELEVVGVKGDNGAKRATPLMAVLGPEPPPPPVPSVPSATTLAATAAAHPPRAPCDRCGCPGWWIPHSLDRWRCGDCEPWPTRALARAVSLVVVGDDGQLDAEPYRASAVRGKLADLDEGEDSDPCGEMAFHEPLPDLTGDPRLRGMHAVHYRRLADEAASEPSGEIGGLTGSGS